MALPGRSVREKKKKHLPREKRPKWCLSRIDPLQCSEAHRFKPNPEASSLAEEKQEDRTSKDQFKGKLLAKEPLRAPVAGETPTLNQATRKETHWTTVGRGCRSQRAEARSPSHPFRSRRGTRCQHGMAQLAALELGEAMPGRHRHRS